MPKAEPEKEIRIENLYPNLPPAELKEAEETLEKYLAFSLRLWERITSDPKEYGKVKRLVEEDKMDWEE